MKIYLARHGEYQNPDEVIPYRLPGFPLTDLGREQALKQADFLSKYQIRDIFCSPIERCLETATIIGKVLKLHPNVKEELIEILSPFEGMKKSEVASYESNFPYSIPKHIEGGGESINDIFERMNNFVSKLKLMSKNSSHLIISHGDPIKYLLSHVLKKEIKLIPMGGLICLDYAQAGIPKYTEII